MIQAELAEHLEKYCVFTQKTNLPRPDECYIITAGFVEKLQENYRGLCKLLSLQDVLNPDTASHIKCCLGELLLCSWLPLDQRKKIGHLAARTLITEIERFTAHRKNGGKMSEAEKEKIKKMVGSIVWLGEWADAEIPLPTSMIMGGKEYIIPAKWDTFLGKILQVEW